MVYHSVRTGEPPDEGFLSGSFRDLRAAVLHAVRLCEKSKRLKSFDMIVVTGISGQAVGFPLALALDKEIVVLRKPDDSSCHGRAGELIGGRRVQGKRCLFVDDFVSMGRTRTRVREAVEAHGGTLVAQCTNDGYQTL